MVSFSDSTCPKDAVCDWAGEYSYKLDINGKEYVLGSLMQRSITIDDYNLSIVDAQYKSLVFRIDKRIDDEQLPIPQEFEFGKEYDLKDQESFAFDNYKVTLLGIDDSICPEGTQCVWEGEYTYRLDINGKEYHLGSVTQKVISFDNYEMELIGAYKDRAIIIVNKKG